MDNFTHSLAGWALGQAGLKRMSGLAVPTLIIAANLPDIDAVLSVLGTQSLALRRGVTHGPIALLILPILLTVAMLAFERWQVRRRKRPRDRLPGDQLEREPRPRRGRVLQRASPCPVHPGHRRRRESHHRFLLEPRALGDPEGLIVRIS